MQEFFSIYNEYKVCSSAAARKWDIVKVCGKEWSTKVLLHIGYGKSFLGEMSVKMRQSYWRRSVSADVVLNPFVDTSETSETVADLIDELNVY